MSAATLSKSQQKRSLTGFQRKKLKSVLVQPYHKYWPLLSEAEDAELKVLFKKILTTFESSDETVAKKKSVPEALRKYISLGMNSSIRSVRNKTADALLISSEINPKFIARQVITLALSRNQNIKVLIVPGLDTLIKKQYKLSATMLTLNSHQEDSVITELLRWIHSVTQNYVVPSAILDRLQVNEPGDTKEPGREVVNKAPEPIDFEHLYVYRNADGGRSFIPSKSNADNNDSSSIVVVTNGDDNGDVEMKDADFLKFSNDPEAEVSPAKHLNNKKKKLKHQMKSKSTYLPLIVNKIQPNPKRKKKQKKK